MRFLGRLVWRLSPFAFEAEQSEKNLPLEVKAILQIARVHQSPNHGRLLPMNLGSQIINESKALFLKNDVIYSG